MLPSTCSTKIRSDRQSAPVTPDAICRFAVACVALDFRLDQAALTAATRGPPRIAFARQVAMYLAHVGFALCFESIGKSFGRDRTTVAHACRLVEDRRDDIWLDCRLASLEAVCRADVQYWATEADGVVG